MPHEIGVKCVANVFAVQCADCPGRTHDPNQGLWPRAHVAQYPTHRVLTTITTVYLTERSY